MFHCLKIKFILISGNKHFQSVLNNCTKQNAALKKAIVPPKKYRKRDQDRSSPDRRDRSPRRSDRSPRRSDNRSSGGRSGQDQKRKSGGHGGSGARSSKDSQSKAKKSKPSSSKKKGMSCDVSDSFYSFLDAEALKMVSDVGLDIDNISNVDSLPLGGRLTKFYDNWSKLNCAEWVLSVIKEGYKIPLKSPPRQLKVPSNPKVVDSKAHEVLVNEANELLAKGAVTVVDPCEDQYVSTYFAVPKPRRIEQYRPILNLKVFNLNVKKYKFTMETLQSVREWIKPGFYCVSLDIKDAYLHIRVHKSSRKYLRFNWLGQLIQWCVIPFGLTCSPRVLTKILKPVIAFIRSTWGILLSIFMDDILLQAISVEQCILHCHIVIIVLMSLGWSIKWAKCDLVPKQNIRHLGFDFNTNQMTISCPPEKITNLQEMCLKIFLAKNISVHLLEQLIGTIESVRPAVPYAALYYRSLQSQLLVAKQGIRIPSKIIPLSQQSLEDLAWWVSKSGFAANCTAPIREPDPTVDIYSDANLRMAGAHTSRGDYFQREWSLEELQQEFHINFLEIRAARESLSLAHPGDIVRLHIDSQTAASYIKKQGGTRSSSLNLEACLLWKEVQSRNLTLLTPHWLSTKENVMADFLSRHQLHQWEFQLSRRIFNLVLDHFHVSPTLDVFASRETRLLPRYMTWYPDRSAIGRDALLHPWDQVSYCFPPIPLILKTLQKIEKEQIEVVMILPQWPSALWWPLVLRLMINPILPLPNYRTILSMVDRSRDLPYLQPLIAVHLKGKI